MFVHTLTDDAKGVLGAISRSRTAAEFYLAGRSAAALHLGHRVSIDLDFFTKNDDYEAESLHQSLRRSTGTCLRPRAYGAVAPPPRGRPIMRLSPSLFTG